MTPATDSGEGEGDATTTDDARPVLVVGRDRLALRVAEELDRRGVTVLLQPSDTDDSSADIDIEMLLERVILRTNRVSLARGEHPDELVREHPDARALVLCNDDDVGNVRIALAAREADPDVRIVARTFNTRLGELLPSVLGDCAVLSTSTIAARPFVDLAVGAEDGSGASPTRRRRFAVRWLDTLRSSDAAAVARQLWRRRLFRALLVFAVLLVALEATIAHLVLDLDADASVQGALASVLTAGLMDVGLAGPALAEHGVGLQFLGASMLVADTLLVAVLFGLIADAVLGERFARVFGGSARRQRGHVVIAGLGTVGYRIAKELTRRGYRCVAIESDPASPFVNPARALGVAVTIADVRQEDEFVNLGVGRALAVLAVTDDDAANLEVGLTVSAIAPHTRSVLRMYDAQLAGRLESASPVDACRSVTMLAAPEFVDAALGIGRR